MFFFSFQVRISFPESGEHIKVEGPVEEVSGVKERLQARIEELMMSHHLETLNVDPKYQSKLLSFLRQYFRSNKVNVRLVKAAECGMLENERHIFLEGEVSAVETTKAEALKMITKWVCHITFSTTSKYHLQVSVIKMQRNTPGLLSV